MSRREDVVPCPFEDYTATVQSEWIDINGHMNVAYYSVVFDRGNYAAGDALGLGADYVERTRHGIFAAETHTLYIRELHLGDARRVRTQIINVDAKRLHFAHELYHVETSERAAAQEVIYLHVDLTTRRVVPFLEQVRTQLTAAGAAHDCLPVPEWCGRRLPPRRTPQT